MNERVRKLLGSAIVVALLAPLARQWMNRKDESYKYWCVSDYWIVWLGSGW